MVNFFFMGRPIFFLDLLLEVNLFDPFKCSFILWYWKILVQDAKNNTCGHLKINVYIQYLQCRVKSEINLVDPRSEVGIPGLNNFN